MRGRCAAGAPDESLAREAGPCPRGSPARAARETARSAARAARADPGTLSRGTLSLVESEYSNQVWSEARVRETMEAYGARVLVLYPGLPEEPAQAQSPFLQRLLRGELPPWLRVAAAGDAAIVLERVAPAR